MAVVETLRDLSYELLGVITDVEHIGFDDVCLETVKRVYHKLATFEMEPDVFWDDWGQPHDSIPALLAQKYQGGWLEEGDVVPISTGKRFPKIDVRLVIRPDGNVDYEAYHG
jgi:hypothetical protein